MVTNCARGKKNEIHTQKNVVFKSITNARSEPKPPHRNGDYANSAILFVLFCVCDSEPKLLSPTHYFVHYAQNDRTVATHLWCSHQLTRTCQRTARGEMERVRYGYASHHSSTLPANVSEPFGTGVNHLTNSSRNTGAQST